MNMENNMENMTVEGLISYLEELEARRNVMIERLNAAIRPDSNYSNPKNIDDVKAIIELRREADKLCKELSRVSRILILSMVVSGIQRSQNERPRKKIRVKSNVEPPKGECAICREEYSARCHKTKCDHIFHTECLNKWLKAGENCPLCRADI